MSLFLSIFFPRLPKDRNRDLHLRTQDAFIENEIINGKLRKNKRPAHPC